jgi:hypothetical protein
MQNLVLNSLNSLKSLETHFKPFQGVQATFKVVLHFADACSTSLITRLSQSSTWVITPNQTPSQKSPFLKSVQVASCRLAIIAAPFGPSLKSQGSQLPKSCHFKVKVLLSLNTPTAANVCIPERH